MSAKSRFPDVKEEIKHLLNESQDPGLVKQICSRVRDILTSGETIEYVAVQKKLVVNPTPDAIVLTNRRFIVYRPKLLGRVTFEDYPWRDLSDVHLEERVVGAIIRLKATNGNQPTVAYLPKIQARRLYALAQEREERVREERRLRDLEEKRAAAGGIVMNSTPSHTSATPAGEPQDPVERLKKLKQMLDAGLISPGEYESKRAEIISKM